MGQVRVFAGGARTAGGGGLAFPQMGFTGRHVRRAVEYSGIWYYELVCISTGVLTVTDALTCDLYLVGSGGLGAAAPATNTASTQPSPGGASGYPTSANGVQLPPGEYGVTVGAYADTAIVLPGGTLAAERGGDSEFLSGVTTFGEGFEGVYHLYGDANLPAGEGGGMTGGTKPASAIIPGRGGGGCSLLPDIFPDWGFSRATTGSNYNWTPMKPEYSGFGAGAPGASPRWASSAGPIYMAYTPGPAAGVCALRVAV
ncbi:MAG: hypothetical protein LBD16_04070 [Oscillospiraceae bacterium]|jgi:hypothetical protein|nr:hypothetical protein [Oscillospiraceae bacterium]